jgi:hypothetical protein
VLSPAASFSLPEPSILFIHPFVFCWETVVDWFPLSIQLSGYRQHCAALDLALLGILFHLNLTAPLDYFIVLDLRLLLFNQNPVYKLPAFLSFLMVLLPHSSAALSLGDLTLFIIE